MKSRAEFRGATAAQESIIAHWQAARAGRDLPRRSDINPGKLRAHLSSISMIELGEDGAARFRLIGSRILSLLGEDARGRELSALTQDKQAMWSLGLMAAAERARPVGGIIPRHNDRHAWLRLPLASGDPDTSLILCHDVILSAEQPEDFDRDFLFSDAGGSLAA